MERPKCDVPCVIRTKDGRELKATFVEIVGGQGGDVETYRVYFKDGDNVDYVCCK